MKIEIKKDYTSFQAGARRMAAALAGIPDRVPVCAQMHEFVMRELGINAKEFYTTPHHMPAGTLAVMDRYGIDVPYLDYDVYNIEAEALGQTVVYSDRGMPDVDRSRPLISGAGDLAKIKTPDFETQGRFPIVIEMQSLFYELTGIGPTLGFCAPFSLAANIMGIENLLMAIDSNPDFTRSLFDKLTDDVLVPWISYQKRTFPVNSGVVGSDATGSLPIVNPQIIKQWIIPWIQRLREVCGPDVYVPNWVGESCLKAPEEMFDLKLQVCPQFLEGQDPDVAALGPAAYRSYADKKGVALVLGIGASFMDLSTPDEVAARVKYYIEAGGKHGRFALYLCNLSAQTPPENLKAALDAVHDYGTYG